MKRAFPPLFTAERLFFIFSIFIFHPLRRLPHEAAFRETRAQQRDDIGYFAACSRSAAEPHESETRG